MSLQAVTDLLTKQKIVEGMVRAQPSRHHALVESVVHNQHQVELQAMLARMPAAEIGTVLDGLSLDDARRLWPQIAPARQNDILWEISGVRAEHLAGPKEPQFLMGDITAYELVDGRMRILEVTSRGEMETLHPIWVDVLGASASERDAMARHFGVELPDPEDLTDLEASARFYVEEHGEIHLHSNFLLDREGQARSVPVAFIVHDGVLFTVRGQELPVFRRERLRLRAQAGDVSNCRDLLLALYAADIEYSADALEDTYATLRSVGKKVLSEHVSDTDAARILAEIAEEEDLNGRIRGNMLDTQRAVSFLMRGRFLSPSQMDDAREIIRDIESLNSHTAFLFEKINFLMDATVGFININQNRRVTQLTIAGVVFMPINVLAGIGGMSEFSMMTKDIPWPIAYGSFMVAMAIIGWGTYQTLRALESRTIKRRLSADAVAEALA